MRRVISVLFLSLCSGLSYGYDWAANPGDGTTSNPYQISTAEQLVSIGSDSSLLSQHFIVAADIHLSSYTFPTAVISPDNTNSNSSFDGTAFTGSFDGRGHTITAMSIDTVGVQNDFLGLFGYLGTGAVVSNLTLASLAINSSADTSYYAGGIAAYSKGTIRNCHVTGSIYIGDINMCTGGIAGQSDALIMQCSANIFASIGGGSGAIGGLVGQNSGQIKQCWSIGTVKSYEYTMRLGGLVGDNVNGTIENSYSGAKVTYSFNNYIKQVGGLVGRTYGGLILNCYSTGQVLVAIGATQYGGLIGLNYGTVTNCFWDTQTSGRSSSAGGTDKVTADMKKIATFTGVSWDFLGESANGVNEIWRMCTDGVNYPKLSWESAISGDFACADGVALDDLLALAGQWITDYAVTPTTFNYACDSNRDDKVDMADLSILSRYWP